MLRTIFSSQHILRECSSLSMDGKLARIFITIRLPPICALFIHTRIRLQSKNTKEKSKTLKTKCSIWVLLLFAWVRVALQFVVSCNDENRNRLIAKHDFKPANCVWAQHDINGNCFGLFSVWWVFVSLLCTLYLILCFIFYENGFLVYNIACIWFLLANNHGNKQKYNQPRIKCGYRVQRYVSVLARFFIILARSQNFVQRKCAL